MSFKILFADDFNYDETWKDPLFLDLRGLEDRKLADKLGTDYRNIHELANKGITGIFLKNEVAGKERLFSAFERCKKFEREAIIVCSSKGHENKIKEMVNEFKRNSAVQS